MIKRGFGIFPDYKPPIIDLPKYKSQKINLGIKGKDHTRHHLRKTERELILRRQNFKCKKCKVNFGKIKPHYDHIKPVSKGGTKGRNLRNIQALCPNCHDIKSRGERKKVKKPKYIFGAPKIPRIKIGI